ncbi:MAG: dihydrolipoyl dehydrogenase [Verrucomicrobiota bacterium]|nr:dihydrolipoyl dehydrogenase [Verrucomicrobiota bacterium]
MSTPTFDLVVIGAGPGGYVCAIRAAQLGLKVALVEKRATLGGTCLNVGCIPSKALLHSTELYHTVSHSGKVHGLKVTGLELDLPALLKRKDDVVAKLVKGVEQLVKARKIESIRGFGQLKGNRQVAVTQSDGTQQLIEGKAIVLASGSVPAELPFMRFDGKLVVSSDDAIAFDTVPKKLVVVGGGAIGLELGSVWSRLGSDVTIVEFLPNIAAGYDEDVCKFAERLFKKQGMKIETGAKVTGLVEVGGKATLTVERDGKTLSFECDKVLVAVGRRPFTDGLGLDNAGVKLDDKKRIVTDDHFRTSAEGIYAIGDSIAGPMLAHKAEEEGVAVAEIIAGKPGHVNYDVIPNVIYTTPEISCVGITERQAREKKLDVKVAKFPLSANGRAIAMDATDGFVKIIADARTDRLLGVQIIATGASELIAEAVAHMEYGGSAEDLGRTVHAHPTLSEALKEAGLSVNKMAIHGL